MKKLLCVIFTFIILTGAASVAYATTDTSAGTAGKSYTDIKTTNWAYDSVTTMSDKGIVKGYPDGSFKPDNKVSYGEFIKMTLIASTGEDAGNATNGNWAESYFYKAVELGYFVPSDINISQLNENISRSDMALIISNILGEIEIDNYDAYELKLEDINLNIKNNSDIVKVYAEGIITGYPDGTFKPNRTLSRAESVVVICRLIDKDQRQYPEIISKDGKLILANFMDISTLSIMRDGEYVSENYTIETAEENGITMLKDRGSEGFAFWLIPEKEGRGVVAVKDGKAIVDCRQDPYFDPEDYEWHGKYTIICNGYAKEDIDYFILTSYENKDETVVVKNPFK